MLLTSIHQVINIPEIPTFHSLQRLNPIQVKSDWEYDKFHLDWCIALPLAINEQVDTITAVTACITTWHKLSSCIHQMSPYVSGSNIWFTGLTWVSPDSFPPNSISNGSAFSAGITHVTNAVTCKQTDTRPCYIDICMNSPHPALLAMHAKYREIRGLLSLLSVQFLGATIGWRNLWSMKLREPGQDIDQRKLGERLWKMTVRHINWTRRMLWIVKDGLSR